MQLSTYLGTIFVICSQTGGKKTSVKVHHQFRRLRTSGSEWVRESFRDCGPLAFRGFFD